MDKTKTIIQLALTALIALFLLVIAVTLYHLAASPVVSADKIQPIIANGNPTLNTIASSIQVIAPGIQVITVNLPFTNGFIDVCHLFYYVGDDKAPLAVSCSVGASNPPTK